MSITIKNHIIVVPFPKQIENFNVHEDLDYVKLFWPTQLVS